MADDGEESEGSATRGADWEVVNLTASTYAAAPGPVEHGSSSAVYTSDMFVFPPSEHENLPIVPDYSEIHQEFEDTSVNAAEEEDDGPDMTDNSIMQNSYAGEQRSGDVGPDEPILSVSDAEFEEGKGLQELKMNIAHDRSVSPPCQDIDSPNYTKEKDDDEYDGSGLPCVAWWKRHVACLCRHAKDANTFWSVIVAAALVGLVILGSSGSKKRGIFSN